MSMKNWIDLRWIGIVGVVCIATYASAQNTFPANGDVGIGTQSPTSALDVYGNVATDSVFGFSNTQQTPSPYGVYISAPAGQTMGLFTNSTQQLTINNLGDVGIGTTKPTELLTMCCSGVNQGIRLGSYWEFGTTAYSNDAYWGINAVLTTSSIPNGTNDFSPIWPGGQGMVMVEDGGGSGDITYFGINWNGSSAQQPFPAAFTPVLQLNYNGTVGIGMAAANTALEVNGAITIAPNSGGAIIFSDGTTQSTAYSGVVCGGDYAESIDVTGDRKHYQPGDVLVIDPNAPGKFLKSVEPYSTAVLGVYSTKPGVLGRRQTTPKSPDEVPMAMVGIVPTKVSAENGAIRPGDLLVTSSKLGYAMKGTDRSKMLGAVIGKALGNLQTGTGVIEVGVTLQ